VPVGLAGTDLEEQPLAKLVVGSYQHGYVATVDSSTDQLELLRDEFF
jgi:hypothetical protein